MNRIYRYMLLLASCLLLCCAEEQAKEPADEIKKEETKDEEEFHYEERVSQTHLMYFPWSNSLTSWFTEANIPNMEKAIEAAGIEDERVLVCIATQATEIQLFELQHDGQECVQFPLKSYKDIDFADAEAIKSIFDDVAYISPSDSYTLSIGSHGRGWLPVEKSSKSRATEEDQQTHFTYNGVPALQMRYFGGTMTKYQTDITTLREAIATSDIKFFEFVLMDMCNMANIEVAYQMRDVTNYLIASPTETNGAGFPYDKMGQYMLGDIDYEKIVEEYYNFYLDYIYPFATVAVIDCREADAMADIMHEINSKYDFDLDKLAEIQDMDGRSSAIFFDMGSYVTQLCSDTQLLERFNEQLSKLVPYMRCTNEFLASFGEWGTIHPINDYSGITISDPSQSDSYNAQENKHNTEWWLRTH